MFLSFPQFVHLSLGIWLVVSLVCVPVTVFRFNVQVTGFLSQVGPCGLKWAGKKSIKNLSCRHTATMRKNDCARMCVWEEGIAALIKVLFFSLAVPVELSFPVHHMLIYV